MPDPRSFLPRRFSLRRWLLDRFCLRPTQHPLDAAPQELFWISHGDLRLACFRQRQTTTNEWNPGPGVDSPRPVDLLIVKFPGNAGRAERSPLHPANVWSEKSIEVWSINPPGYGQSHGRASLDHVPSVAEAVWEEIQRQFPTTPILIYGNSIGSLTAMKTVATALQRQPLVRMGLMLRNPPDLFPLILEHYRRWYHGPVPWWLTRGSEPHLDSVALAAACHCPLLMIQAEYDRMVPPANQDRIFAAHPGPKTKFVIPGANHDQAPNPDDEEQYKRYTSTIRQTLDSLVSRI